MIRKTGFVKPFFAVVVPLLAGVGVATIADSKILGKAPGYDEPISPGFKPKKLVWFIGAFVLAHYAIKFLTKKLNIHLLK